MKNNFQKIKKFILQKAYKVGKRNISKLKTKGDDCDERKN